MILSISLDCIMRISGIGTMHSLLFYPLQIHLTLPFRRQASGLVAAGIAITLLGGGSAFADPAARIIESICERWPGRLWTP